MCIVLLANKNKAHLQQKTYSFINKEEQCALEKLYCILRETEKEIKWEKAIKGMDKGDDLKNLSFFRIPGNAVFVADYPAENGIAGAEVAV